MRVVLAREYRFDAAHRLPRLPPGHKCARLHGHGFRVEIEVAGPVDPESGFLIDYGDIDRVVKPLLERLDHACLNDIEGLENPTSELLAAWLWRAIAPGLPQLSAVTVAETCRSRCTYRGD